MKNSLCKFLFTCVFVIAAVSVQAQNIAINSNGAAPDSSAMLDVSDTTRGFLPPRLNTAQMNNVNSPAEGLMIYNTDSAGYFYNDGTNWLSITTLSPTSSTVDNVGESGVAIIKDVKSAGTNGGSATSGIWITRDLNTVEGDNSFVSITSNEFTLSSGVYLLEWSTPAFQGGIHRSRLYDNTNSIVISLASNSHISSNAQSNSNGNAVLNIPTSTSYIIQHRLSSGNGTLTNQLGSAGNSVLGDAVYTQVKIIKLDKVFGSGVNSGQVASTSDTLSIITDADGDTKIQVEATTDEDIIRFDLDGVESFVFNSGSIDVKGSDNLFVGQSAGANITSGITNSAFGGFAQISITSGSSNSTFGYGAMQVLSTGDQNSGFGAYTMNNLTTGNRNTSVGLGALTFNEVGSNNVALGFEAGKGTATNSKSGGVFLGYQAGLNENTDNKLYIENSNSSTPLIYGDFANDSLIIGGTLTIDSAFTFPTDTGTLGQIMKSTGTGQAVWANPDAVDKLEDLDDNTTIRVEENFNENLIRFELDGTEHFIMREGRLEFINFNDNILIGDGAGISTTGGSNVALGTDALSDNISGGDNVAIGDGALSKALGDENVAMGSGAGANTTGDGNVFIGNRAGGGSNSSNKLYIDNSNTADPLIYGDFNLDSISLNGHVNINDEYAFPLTDGIASQTLVTDGNGSLRFGFSSELADTDLDTKIELEADNDEDSIRFTMAGTEYFIMGRGHLEVVNTGRSIFIGEDAGENDDFGNRSNLAFGRRALRDNVTGSQNIALGESALESNTGDDNIAIGAASQEKVVGGIENVSIGTEALSSVVSGNGNVAIGTKAGAATQGSGNIFLGFEAGRTRNVSNQMYIDNSDTQDPIIWADFATDSLVFNGVLTIDSLKDGSGYTFPGRDGNLNDVLQTNGSGKISWTSLASAASFWNQSGSDINYMAGSVGIGTNTPADKVHLLSTSSVRYRSETTSGEFSGFVANNTNGEYFIGVQGTADGNSGEFHIYQNAGGGNFGQRMVIDHDGNVGIGTSDPFAPLSFANTVLNKKLTLYDVNDNDHEFLGFGTDNATLRYQVDNVGAAHVFYAATSATTSHELMTVQGNGNVGIGTSTPSLNLVVTDSAVSSVIGIHAANNTGDAYVSYISDGSARFVTGYHKSTNSFKLGSNIAGNSLVINPSGNIGVGTASPAVKLHVDGGSDVSLSNGSGYFMTGIESGLNMVIDNNEIQVRNNGAFSNLFLQTDGGDFYLHSAQNDSTRFRVFNNGAVTIGTANSVANAKLYVDGRLQFGSVEYFEDGGGFTTTSSSSLVPATDNIRTLGTASLRWASVFATNGVINTSDRRDKENILPIGYGLSEVLQLNPVSYSWKGQANEGSKLGLVAQDLLKVIPEVVKTKDWVQKENGEKEEVTSDRLGVYYSDLIPVLIKAIQEQNTTIEELKIRIETLESEK